MNKKVLILTLFIIMGMIVIPTVYKVYKKHKEDLVIVVEKEFLYQAKKCYHETNCLNTRVYLKELYDHKYLEDKLTNPDNKKYYSDESYIDLNTLEIKLIS